MLNLIDRLEALVAEGKRIPWLGRAMVSEREFMDVIDQLRVSLPDELRQARRITQECDRMLAEARDEADRTVAAAREQADQLVQEHEVTRQAERQADAIQAEAERRGLEVIDAAQLHSQQMVAEAREQALAVRAGAEEYARGLLSSMKQDLEKQLGIVDKGLSVLERPLRDVSPR